MEDENENIAICPVGLESLTTDLYFTSDDYLYHKKCFSKSSFKSLISRPVSLYFFPANKLVNDKVYFEKKTLKITLEKLMVQMDLIKMDSTEKDLKEMDLT